MAKRRTNDAQVFGDEAEKGVRGQPSRSIRDDEQDRGNEREQRDGSGEEDGAEAREGQESGETEKVTLKSSYGEHWRGTIFGVTYRIWLPEPQGSIPMSRIELQCKVSIGAEKEEWTLAWRG